MKLKQLKLSGFKSFVDATTLAFPSNLNAVLGPNGCGKSNVIDAVRWVMGESSAKYLRGELMTDVIFNGSLHRHPVGQAYVELVFDNSDVAIGGEYASYSEIAIKRLVTRDGQSQYFINNTRCRRRDVADIFLGTGLGPRSYAVIEQGMISRFIEAKPEELRVHLEEAAGISKYKERRRETELRMGHTNENLTRLNDLYQENVKLVERLERQAETAEKYKILRQEERQLRAELLAMRWRELEEYLQKHVVLIEKQQTALEAGRAELQHVLTLQEKQHLLQEESHEAFNNVQDRFYRQGAVITEFEQSLKHQKQRLDELQLDLEKATASLQQNQQNFTDDQRRLQSLEQNIQELTPQLQDVNRIMVETSDALKLSEQLMQQWQQQWDILQQKSSTATQEAQVEQTRIQHLEQNYQATQKRIADLQQQQQQQPKDELQQQIETLESEWQGLQQQIQHHEVVLQQTLQHISQQRQQNQETTHALDQKRSELQKLRGQLASLEALQQEALGQKDKSVMEWLAQHQLTHDPRFAQGLRVEKGYERAVETVLGEHLQAVCTDNFESVASALSGLTKGSVVLMNRNHTADFSFENSPEFLIHYVQSDWPIIQELLANILVVESLEQALKRLTLLDKQQSIITKDGMWLGRGWVRVHREKNMQQGILEREHELTVLKQKMTEYEQLVNEKQTVLVNGQQTLTQFEQQREEQQRQLSALKSQQNQIHTQIGIQKTRSEQMKERALQIEKELQHLNQQLIEVEQSIQAARHRWQQSMQAMNDCSDEKQTLQGQRDELSQTLQQRRDAARQLEQQQRQLEIKLQSTNAERNALLTQMKRSEENALQMKHRHDELQQAIETQKQPIPMLEQQLEQALEQRLSIEQELQQVKHALDTIEADYRELEQKRQHAERHVSELNEQFQNLQLEVQTLKVKKQSIEEQYDETDMQLTAVLSQLVTEASILDWEQQLQKVERQIQRLGPINLAAIEEYKEQFERKNYLEAQMKDLQDALQALEEAIRKIDRETKARFKETFDVVNDNFKKLFPKLFGGGSAELILTDENLLETGITMMARPPGKRNATVQLLSGGEKALTAISLVFSIFQLNPAPFCLLDEVDAPLDDANVARFSQLVKEMSQTVQFIFITHNKLTMEMAEYLTGITMSEPGVSRPVTVNMQDALKLAETV